jgi:hypothetical protein
MKRRRTIKKTLIRNRRLNLRAKGSSAEDLELRVNVKVSKSDSADYIEGRKSQQ